MEETTTLKVLDMLISFFETGNAATDGVAKIMFKEDGEYDDYWLPKIEAFSKSVEWTGIRGPEAEILTNSLHEIRKQMELKE